MHRGWRVQRKSLNGRKIWLPKPILPFSEATPAMADVTLPLPGLSPASGKAVVARFDGGELSSDAGVLVLREIETRLGVAHRQHPARRGRGTLLRHAEQSAHGRLTQTKRPPANPGRFRAVAQLGTD